MDLDVAGVACVTGVKKGMPKERFGRACRGRPHYPSPFPFNPSHAGYTFFVIDWVSFGTPALLFFGFDEAAMETGPKSLSKQSHNAI